MIKKDVVYRNECENENKKKKTSQEQQRSVDEIFANADADMAAMSSANTVNMRPKKRMNIFKRTFLSVLITAIVAIALFAVLVIKSLSQSLPNMKETVIEQFNDAKEDLLLQNDSDLSVDEYYQKQIFLLITEDALQEQLEDISSLEALANLLKNGEMIDLDLIPEDKKDEYERLIKEYEAAKAKELESMEGNEMEGVTEESSSESVEETESVNTSKIDTNTETETKTTE